LKKENIYYIIENRRKITMKSNNILLYIFIAFVIILITGAIYIIYNKNNTQLTMSVTQPICCGKMKKSRTTIRLIFYPGNGQPFAIKR
jgi:hypothetical protein